MRIRYKSGKIFEIGQRTLLALAGLYVSMVIGVASSCGILGVAAVAVATFCIAVPFIT